MANDLRGVWVRFLNKILYCALGLAMVINLNKFEDIEAFVNSVNWEITVTNGIFLQKVKN